MDEKHVDDSVNTKSINEKLKSLDKESATVEYTGIWGKLIAALCICFSLFQIYTGFFGAFDAMIQRCVHLSFGISLVFLLCPTKKAWIRGGKVNPLDLGLAILAAIPPIYILVNYQSLILRAGTVTTTDFIIGLLGIVSGKTYCGDFHSGSSYFVPGLWIFWSIYARSTCTQRA